MLQPDGKKIKERIKEERLMSMDDSSSREVEVNFFDKDALFTLWFYLINFCLPKAGIYRNNQGIANKKKTKNTGIGKADKLGISRADIEKNLSRGRANVKKSPGISKIDKSSISKADKPGISRVRKPGISGIDKSCTNKTNKPGISKVDKPGIGKVDKSGIGGANKPGISGVDKLGIVRANKVGIDRVKKSDT